MNSGFTDAAAPMYPAVSLCIAPGAFGRRNSVWGLSPRLRARRKAVILYTNSIAGGALIKKRIISTILCLCLALALLPATAQAAPSTQVTIDGVVYTENTNAAGWQLTFGTNQTLLSLHSYTGGAIYANDDLTVAVTNTNTITAAGELHGFCVMGDVVFRGNGALTITGGESDSDGAAGLYVAGDASIRVLTLNVTGGGGESGGNAGIAVGGSLEITDGATVTATGGTGRTAGLGNGIQVANGDVEITNEAVVVCEGRHGLYAGNGGIFAFSGGRLTGRALAFAETAPRFGVLASSDVIMVYGNGSRIEGYYTPDDDGGAALAAGDRIAGAVSQPAGGAVARRDFTGVPTGYCTVLANGANARSAALVARTGAILFVDPANGYTGETYGYDGSGGYEYIYYGVFDTTQDGTDNPTPVRWQVLDDKTSVGGQGLFLLADRSLCAITFDSDLVANDGQTAANEWQHSEAQGWCDRFELNNLHPTELNAVLPTTVNDPYHIAGRWGLSFSASENILNGDRIFFLSAREAEHEDYGIVATTDVSPVDYWWLRSPGNSSVQVVGSVAIISGGGNGNVYYRQGNSPAGVRPALNLDLSAVFFVSSAKDGKSAAGMDSKLTAVPAAMSNERKLTLFDGARNDFAAARSSGSTDTLIAGQTVLIDYRNAPVDQNEYISAMITDGGGSILYYGRVASSEGNREALPVVIPSTLASGSYTLKIFSEQYNGDYKTDYAGGVVDIPLTVLGTQGVPATGETTSEWIWLGLMLLALGGVAVLGVRSKKRTV